MFDGFLEPYRREEGALDSQILGLVAASFLGARSAEGILTGLFLLIFVALLGLAIWLTYLNSRYLWALYTKQEMPTGPRAKALKVILGSWVAVVAVTIILFNSGAVDDAFLVNITGIAFITFAYVVTQTDKDEPMNPQLPPLTQTPNKRSHIKDFLKRKNNKQP